MTIQGKGGYTLHKCLAPELTKSLRDLMVDGVFKISQAKYRKNPEESARISDQKYMGTHGLRYNYAQELYNKNFDKFLSQGIQPMDAHQYALTETSEEIGHHRGEITMHYLG